MARRPPVAPAQDDCDAVVWTWPWLSCRSTNASPATLPLLRLAGMTSPWCNCVMRSGAERQGSLRRSGAGSRQGVALVGANVRAGRDVAVRVVAGVRGVAAGACATWRAWCGGDCFIARCGRPAVVTSPSHIKVNPAASAEIENRAAVRCCMVPSRRDLQGAGREPRIRRGLLPERQRVPSVRPTLAELIGGQRRLVGCRLARVVECGSSVGRT